VSGPIILGLAVGIYMWAGCWINRRTNHDQAAGRGYVDGLCLTCGQPEHRTMGMLVPWWEVHPTRRETLSGHAFIVIPICILILVDISAAVTALVTWGVLMGATMTIGLPRDQR